MYLNSLEPHSRGSHLQPHFTRVYVVFNPLDTRFFLFSGSVLVTSQQMDFHDFLGYAEIGTRNNWLDSDARQHCFTLLKLGTIEICVLRLFTVYLGMINVVLVRVCGYSPENTKIVFSSIQNNIYFAINTIVFFNEYQTVYSIRNMWDWLRSSAIVIQKTNIRHTLDILSTQKHPLSCAPVFNSTVMYKYITYTYICFCMLLSTKKQ